MTLCEASLYIDIDEAGRGCLAGPVVAAAVILPCQEDARQLLPGLNDSKKLRASQREALYPRIQRHSLAWSLGLSWQDEIDAVNILNATMRAMSRAAARVCRLHPELALRIDGNLPIREQAWHAVTQLPLPPQSAIIGGDSLIPGIAAASILAKTFRDKLMTALAKRYPGYAFAKHKGYGTAAHLAAITRLGPCRIHRTSFRGVTPIA